MDCMGKQERKINPIKHAGWLSQTLVLFAFPLFRKGEIGESDIYETLDSLTSKNLGDAIEDRWEKEKKQENPSFLRPLLRQFGKDLFLLIASYLAISSVTMFAKPILVGKIVAVFDTSQEGLTKQNGFLYCGALIAWMFIQCLVGRFCSFETDRLLLKIKIASSSIIYRKLLKAAQNDKMYGQAITLVTKDLNAFSLVLLKLYPIIMGVMQILIFGYLMYKKVGISAIIGMSWLLMYLPLQGIFGKLLFWFRLRAAKQTDRRIKSIQAVLTSARIIKMYSWEGFHSKMIDKIRQNEMSKTRAMTFIRILAQTCGYFYQKLIFCTIVLLYISYGEPLTAESAFIVTTSVQLLGPLLQKHIPLGLLHFGNFKVAMQRLTAFLMTPEVQTHAAIPQLPAGNRKIFVNKLSVEFHEFKVLNNITFSADQGLTIIKGAVGTGKSTLLKAILGEVPRSSGAVLVNGSVSYASQEPWLFPGTLRQNILFGNNYDSRRYNNVIRVCCLEKDLASLSKGDKTYLTDRGLNLSKGQKARINLARCVYKNSDIYLLDDCFSSLNVSVANNIFLWCIKDYLREKVCILVSHNSAYHEMAQQVLQIDTGILRQPTGKDAEVDNSLIAFDNCSDDGINRALDLSPNELHESNESTKLLADTSTSIYKEHNEEGVVSKKSYYFYLSSGNMWVFAFIVILMGISQGILSWVDYFVSIWITENQKLSTLRHQPNFNSTTYTNLEQAAHDMTIQFCGMSVAGVCVLFASLVGYLFFTNTASINIHRNTFSKVMQATMQFYDQNLSGNVVNRFSSDIAVIDQQVATDLQTILQTLWVTLVTLFVVSSVKPYLFLPSGLILVILYFARRAYLPTSRSIRRLEGSTRSPVVGYINSTADGLVTIRAHKMENVLAKEFESHMDVYSSAMFMTYTVQSVFWFVLDTLGSAYVSLVTLAMLSFNNGLLSGQVGLAITQSIMLTGAELQSGIYRWGELESYMTSAERILAYTKIKSEHQSGRVPVDWPKVGKIEYKNVTLTYPSTGDLVLRNVTFTVESKGKLGVIGRTGAGKSSLISVLFRLYEFHGCIKVDGVDISDIDLQYFRSRVSVIPQDPYFFSGTLRENLDPNDEYTDDQLWDALSKAEAKNFIENLNAQVLEDGNNFSIGQKQLFCLARAILQQNTILVLDEATSGLDSKADAIIQETIRNHFCHCTLITIAHRISTIVDSDNILVLENGEVIEYGSPTYLLGCRGSYYNAVKDAGLLP